MDILNHRRKEIVDIFDQLIGYLEDANILNDSMIYTEKNGKKVLYRHARVLS